uniref:Nucleosome assembly protein 1-like 4a n=1 Tax=Sinocyclocheilus grahami TaxID=75366 RepID=A0A672QXT7_SINGR
MNDQLLSFKTGNFLVWRQASSSTFTQNANKGNPAFLLQACPKRINCFGFVLHTCLRNECYKSQCSFVQRRDIVAGAVEPTEEECEWQSDREEEDLAEDLQKKAALEEKQADSAGADDPKGIPEFWLTIFKRVDMLEEMLQEHDEPILKHLQDITVKFSEPAQPMSFTLEFYFEPNSYFSNTVLTKVYKMKSEPDTADPFSFEGPEIIDCEGLDWRYGSVLVFHSIIYSINFHWMLIVSVCVQDEDLDFTLGTDFEIGHFFRERVIPKAVLYFTGEALEDDESYEEEDLEEGEEEVRIL